MNESQQIRKCVVEYGDAVRDKIGVPLDFWAVAATLESLGVRDIDAVEKCDSESLFEFAKEVYGYLVESVSELDEETRSVDETIERDWSKFFRHLFHGSFFAFPMIGQMLCIFLTRYSLWASLDFEEQQATVVGIGTVASFAITGGLIMCIGRQGTVYRELKEFELLRRTCWSLAAVGAACVLITTVISVLINLTIPLIELRALIIALLYFVTLCAMWVGLGILYMLGLHAYSTGVTVVGALVVAWLVRSWGVPVYAAQLSAISGTATVAFAVGLANIRARRNAATGGGVLLERLPPPDMLAGILLPFGMYGTAYFSLLFADRLFAWTAPGRAIPQPMWFHTPYELGMDWGLITLLLPMAFLEHVVHEFSPLVLRIEEKVYFYRSKDLSAHISSFVYRSIAVLAIFSIVSVLLGYFGVATLRRFDDIQEIRDFFANPITEDVFWLAAVAYQLLTLGLMFSLLFFTLAHGNLVVRTMWQTLVIAGIVGFVSSRFFAPHWAVLGFLGACLFFSFRMVQSGVRFAREIDYYYYAAF